MKTSRIPAFARHMECSAVSSGLIYGKTTDYTLAQPLVLLLNGDVCNEYGVNTDDIQSLEDLEPYLQSLADEGKRGLLLDSTCELY